MGLYNAESADLLGGHEHSVLKTCPLCTCEYSQSDVQVLEEEEGLQLIHVTCASCQNAILAYIVESTVGLSSVGMLTDLTVTDVTRLRDTDPVGDNEVLALSQALRHDQQDFIHLLMHRKV